VNERWWLAADARKVLGDRADLSVAGWMQAAADGEVLSTDRDSAAVHLQGPGMGLLVKWRAVPAAKRWRWWLRPSRERTEARGLQAARTCGIDAPEPLAVGERRDALGRLVGSVLVRTFIDGFTADEFLADAISPTALAELAGSLRRWHDAGYRHGDCWPKNLLVVGDGSGDLPIGAPNAFAGVAGPGLDRARFADLARFAAGFGELWPDRDPFAFLDDYVAAPPVLSRAVVEAGVRPLFEHVLEKRAEDVRTRPAREPNGPPFPAPLPADAHPPRRVVHSTAGV
jgi:hypothetical protein